MSEHSYLQLGGFNAADYDMPVDPRLTLHKEEMLTVGTLGNPYTGKLNDGTLISLPTVYFCICYEDNKLYTFNVNNTYEGEFGKFRESKGSGGTEVIPNPEEPATDAVNKLKIDNIVYEVSDAAIKKGLEAPTEETEGEVGQLYIDQTTPGLYQCDHLKNNVIIKDPGTQLPIGLGVGWGSVRVSDIEKILFNGGAPQHDTEGVRGQLFVDTKNCDLYICLGQADTLNFVWERIRKSIGFNLNLDYSSYVPYKVLYANGNWEEVKDPEQKLFLDAVAFILNDNQKLTAINKGLLSDPKASLYEEKTGYTLFSDVEIKITNN